MLWAAAAWALGQYDFQTHLPLQRHHTALARWGPAGEGVPSEPYHPEQ